MLDFPRVSGRALPGSRLVLAARHYDGCGVNGGAAHDYANLFVVFLDKQGFKRRTVGVALHRAELRQIAAAIVEHADALDAAVAHAHQ